MLKYATALRPRSWHVPVERRTESSPRGQTRAVMNIGDFIARNTKRIEALWKTVAPSVVKAYGVTEREFAERLAGISLRTGSRPGPEGNPAEADEADDLLANIKA